MTIDTNHTDDDSTAFDRDEEDILFDAWQMLRWYGLSKAELEPFTRVIDEETPNYTEGGLDSYYEEHVAE